mmetsp:Transcript_8308/g.23077  ORF Transcript_8308/g.23077 Transcript_8308/m.23077 type:complete len:250 (+) Transcript_8308:411-1160(+)
MASLSGDVEISGLGPSAPCGEISLALRSEKPGRTSSKACSPSGSPPIQCMAPTTFEFDEIAMGNWFGATPDTINLASSAVQAYLNFRSEPSIFTRRAASASGSSDVRKCVCHLSRRSPSIDSSTGTSSRRDMGCFTFHFILHFGAAFGLSSASDAHFSGCANSSSNFASEEVSGCHILRQAFGRTECNTLAACASQPEISTSLLLPRTFASASAQERMEERVSKASATDSIDGDSVVPGPCLSKKCMTT